MALRWRDKRYSTGVDVIDAQHRQLFEHIDSLLKADNPQDRQEELDDLLHFLVDYADVYLPREEAIMDAYNCPAREENRKDHALFRAELDDLHDRYLCDGMTELLREDVMRLMILWLETHVAGVDARLRRISRQPVVDSR